VDEKEFPPRFPSRYVERKRETLEIMRFIKCLIFRRRKSLARHGAAGHSRTICRIAIGGTTARTQDLVPGTGSWSTATWPVALALAPAPVRTLSGA
jgi:hypothetical protein